MCFGYFCSGQYLVLLVLFVGKCECWLSRIWTCFFETGQIATKGLPSPSSHSKGGLSITHHFRKTKLIYSLVVHHLFITEEIKLHYIDKMSMLEHYNISLIVNQILIFLMPKPPALSEDFAAEQIEVPGWNLLVLSTCQYIEAWEA